MASIEPYQTKAGRRWKVHYRKPNRKPTTKRGFKTKRDATLFAATVETRKAEGLYVDPAAGRVTVEDMGRRWLETQSHVKASSQKVYETAYRVHIAPEFGAYPVASVDRQQVREWVARKSEALSARTVRRAHFVLQAILETAVEDRRIPENPARRVKNLPQVRHRKNVYLTYEQVEAVAAAADAHPFKDRRGVYGTVIYLAAYVGLRWSEIATLTPDDVDLQSGRVRVRAEVSKSGEERRPGYPGFLQAPLRELVVKATPGGVLLAGIREPKTEESWFRGVVQRAGLPAGFRFHDLRHSAASFAVSSGASVKVVQHMLGHKRAAETLDVYSDLFDSDVDDVAERIDRKREEAVVRMLSRDGPGAAEGE